MTFNQKAYAQSLRDELDDFAEVVRHKIMYGQTLENYVFKIQYISQSGGDILPIEVENHEYEVFHDMPERVLEFSSTSGKRMSAKIFHEGDRSYLIRSKDFGTVEEVVSWHDAGLMISQILSSRNEL